MPEETKELLAVATIYTLKSDSTMALQVGIVREAIVKHNQGKFAQLAKFSPESLVEHFLETGMRSTLTAIDADMERRNKDAYCKESGKLQTPDPSKPEELVAYFTKMQLLRTKYGIGGDSKEV